MKALTTLFTMSLKLVYKGNGKRFSLAASNHLANEPQYKYLDYVSCWFLRYNAFLHAIFLKLRFVRQIIIHSIFYTVRVL